MFNAKINLKSRMLLASLIVLLLAFGTVGITFWRTAASLQRKYVESLDYIAREISNSIDEIVYNIQNVSDAFANEPRLHAYLNGDYSAGGDTKRGFVEKRYAISRIRHNIFGGFNRLRDINQISAVYNANSGEFFNFVDPNKLDKNTIARLLSLRITDEEKLSRICWYPLQENFLREPITSTPRKGSAVIGSRRIYSGFSASYPYVHIFAIPEQRLYECYDDLIPAFNGEVYILDAQGNLLSSSNLKSVEAFTAPNILRQAVLDRTQDRFELDLNGVPYFVSIQQSALGGLQPEKDGWITVIMAPKSYATERMKGLYIAIVAAMTLSVGLCVLMLLYLYKRFMDPISDLSAAMKRVDAGDMNAYVERKRPGNEAGMMLDSYNRMLESININIKKTIALEQAKQDLEMQVLTAQINPHFLYNTLETIVWKAGEAGRHDIGKIAASLGKLYRLSCGRGGVLVPLGHEISHVTSYVDIQRSRYEGHFTFECHVDSNFYDVKVPKLMIQPLVENIFCHVLPESEALVHIRLLAERQGKDLRICVSNSGSGLTKDNLSVLQRQIRTGECPPGDVPGYHSRVGLYNINARLGIYLGIKNALEFTSAEESGTEVVIRIPLHPQHGEDKNCL